MTRAPSSPIVESGGFPSSSEAMRRSVDQCRAIIRHHSKSFSLASRLLPRSSRDNAVVVYAWCRRADDAIDQAVLPSGPGDAKEAVLDQILQRLRDELDHLYAGHHQTDPVLAAFQQVVFHRHIPILYPSELLAGMEMDVRPMLYRTMDDLLLYCHRVAGIVGLMMCHVLGIADDEALPHAAHMGLAMQITNICRDVEEDWQRGRCYIPQAMLSPTCALVLTQPAIAKLPDQVRMELKKPVHDLLQLADRYYRSGDAGLKYLDATSAWAIRTARLVYSAIGTRLARQGFDVGAGRAVVPTSRKLLLVVESLGEALATLPRRAFRHSTPQIPTRLLEYPAAVELPS